MASEPKQLEQEIALTREQLRKDVDALVDRVSPTRVAQRQVDRIRPTFDQARDEITRRPVAVGVATAIAVTVLAAIVISRRLSS